MLGFSAFTVLESFDDAIDVQDVKHQLRLGPEDSAVEILAAKWCRSSVL